MTPDTPTTTGSADTTPTTPSENQTGATTPEKTTIPTSGDTQLTQT